MENQNKTTFVLIKTSPLLMLHLFACFWEAILGQMHTMMLPTRHQNSFLETYRDVKDILSTVFVITS